MTEKDAWSMNGYVGIFVIIVLLGVGMLNFLNEQLWIGLVFSCLGLILFTGLTVMQPNQSAVILFFGKFIGTIRKEGLIITVPFTVKRKISLRIRHFNSNRLKVNDVNGNPIEIAAVIVFKVVDSAKTVFDVDEYEEFVEIQSETALRAVATKNPYDRLDDSQLSLQGNPEEISDELKVEVHDRLYVAGVEVIEARLTHLRLCD